MRRFFLEQVQVKRRFQQFKDCGLGGQNKICLSHPLRQEPSFSSIQIEDKCLSEDVDAAAQFPFLALTTALCCDNFGPLKPSAWDSTRDPIKGTAVLETRSRFATPPNLLPLSAFVNTHLRISSIPRLEIVLGSLPASLALPSWWRPHYLAGHGGVLDLAVDHHPGKNAFKIQVAKNITKVFPLHPELAVKSQLILLSEKRLRKEDPWKRPNYDLQWPSQETSRNHARHSRRINSPLALLKTFLNLWIGFPFIRTVAPWATPLIMSPWIPQLHEAHPLDFFCLKKWIPVQDAN